MSSVPIWRGDDHFIAGTNRRRARIAACILRVLGKPQSELFHAGGLLSVGHRLFREKIDGADSTIQVFEQEAWLVTKLKPYEFVIKFPSEVNFTSHEVNSPGQPSRQIRMIFEHIVEKVSDGCSFPSWRRSYPNSASVAAVSVV